MNIFLALVLAMVISANVYADETMLFDIGDGRLVKLPMTTPTSKEMTRLNNSDNNDFIYDVSGKRNNVSLKEKMTPVKHQENRATCNVFSTIGLIEYYERGDLSEQCLAWLSRDGDGGHADESINWSIRNGLYHESDCEYDGGGNGRSNIPDLTEKTKVWPSDGYMSVNSEILDPIGYIRAKIDQGHPVIVSIFLAGHGWQKAGVIDVPTDDEISETCEKNTVSSGYKKCGGHSIIVVGYDDDYSYLEFKNSWGATWPIVDTYKGNGFGRMSYAYYLKMRKSKLVSK